MSTHACQRPTKPVPKRFVWCLALLLLPTLTCRAGDPETGVALRSTLALGLAEPAVASGRAAAPGSRLSALVVRAWQENPEVAVSQASVLASQARLEQAQAELRPQVSLRADATLSRVDGADYAVSENYMSGQLNAVYPLYRPRLTRGVSVAEAQVGENREAALEAANALALQLISVYLDLNNLREDLRVIDAESALVDSLRVVNVRRLEGGIGANTEVAESEFRAKMVTSQGQALRLDIALLRDELRRLSHEAAADALELGVIGKRLVPDRLDAARELLEHHNPGLLRAREVTRQASLRRQAEADSRRPTLDVIGQVDVGRSTVTDAGTDTQTTRSVALQFDLPLYTGGLQAAREREMAAAETKATLEALALRERLLADLARAYAELEKAEEQIATYTEGLELARAVSERTRRAFLAGFRDNIDVINAQRQISEVGRDLAKARAGSVLAQARILALTGQLDGAALRALDAYFLP